jgi:hypothetical protein
MIPASGWRTLRSVLTSTSTPDQVHACQMMTEVHTVSIVAKNKYSGRAGVRAPKRGGTKVRKPFTRVQIAPAMIFASRFALNGTRSPQLFLQFSRFNLLAAASLDRSIVPAELGSM